MMKFGPLPPLVLESITAYVEQRRPPGAFVTAVLCNDLRDAITRADPGSLAALPDIVGYCHWEIPGPCWGTPERVAAWLVERPEADPKALAYLREIRR